MVIICSKNKQNQIKNFSDLLTFNGTVEELNQISINDQIKQIFKYLGDLLKETLNLSTEHLPEEKLPEYINQNKEILLFTKNLSIIKKVINILKPYGIEQKNFNILNLQPNERKNIKSEIFDNLEKILTKQELQNFLIVFLLIPWHDIYTLDMEKILDNIIINPLIMNFSSSIDFFSISKEIKHRLKIFKTIPIIKQCNSFPSTKHVEDFIKNIPDFSSENFIEKFIYFLLSIQEIIQNNQLNLVDFIKIYSACYIKTLKGIRSKFSQLTTSKMQNIFFKNKIKDFSKAITVLKTKIGVENIQQLIDIMENGTVFNKFINNSTILESSDTLPQISNLENTPPDIPQGEKNTPSNIPSQENNVINTPSNIPSQQNNVINTPSNIPSQQNNVIKFDLVKKDKNSFLSTWIIFLTGIIISIFIGLGGLIYSYFKIKPKIKTSQELLNEVFSGQQEYKDSYETVEII